MTTNPKNQLNTQILISHYVFERETEIERLKNLQQSHGVSLKSKRPIGRIHHRTRSHKSFKMPRKQKNNKRKASKMSSSRKEENRCRKHRRRAYNIHFFKPAQKLSNSKRLIKLPNHVWNAKRMVMEEYYGYHLPMRSSYRGIKTLEKIIQSKTVVHDMSYYKCFKVVTTWNDFIKFLDTHSDPNGDCVQEMEKKMNRTNESKEFEILIYGKEEFPNHLIGPVTITVKFGSSFEILVWSHPSIYTPILSIFREFSADRWEIEEDLPLSRLWFSGNNLSTMLNQLFQFPSSSITSLSNRKDEGNKKGGSLFSSIDGKLEEQHFAFFQHSTQKNSRLKNVWKANNVLSLLIQDPRTKKLENKQSSSDLLDCPNSFNWPKASGNSICWEKSKLKELQFSFPQEKEIIKQYQNMKFLLWSQAVKNAQQSFLTSSNTVPNPVVSSTTTTLTTNSTAPAFTPANPLKLSRKDFKEQKYINSLTTSIQSFQIQSMIPILLTYSPSTSSQSIPSALQHSFMMIFPTIYMKSFWNEMLKSRKHQIIPIGLDEMNYIKKWQQKLTFPNDYPDTFAGWKYWKDYFYQEKLLNKKELKKPKAKRLSWKSFFPLQFPNYLHEEIALIDQQQQQQPQQGEGAEDPDWEDVKEEQDQDREREEQPAESVDDAVNQSMDDVGGDETGESEDISIHKKFLIVHDKKYYAESIPPRFSPSSRHHHHNHHRDSNEDSSDEEGGDSEGDGGMKGLLHCLQHHHWQSEDADNENSELIPLLPPVSTPTFIYLSLRPYSRGLPESGALLFLPSKNDLRNFLQHHLHSKIHARDPSSSHLLLDFIKKWKGVDCRKVKTNNDENDNHRMFLGFVTNGFAPRTNSHFGSSRITVIGVGNIQKINEWIHENYGRFSHPLSHSFVLCQNPHSDWMRPMLYDFL